MQIPVVQIIIMFSTMIILCTMQTPVEKTHTYAFLLLKKKRV